jgi:hypothetical protein
MEFKTIITIVVPFSTFLTVQRLLLFSLAGSSHFLPVVTSFTNCPSLLHRTNYVHSNRWIRKTTNVHHVDNQPDHDETIFEEMVTTTTMSNVVENEAQEKEPSRQKPSKKTVSTTTTMTLQELSFREEQASRELLQRLLLPSRISQAWTRMIQLFVVIGILLNAFGYGYVRTEYGIGIDTLEHQQFQMQLRQQQPQPQPQHQEDN